MTKREFAAKLLMWLLPWPISRALPKSFRIYYFGPAGGPPSGFYDYWGTPGEYWDGMYNPPPVDTFPDPPDFPVNPGDPYTPGPGPIYTYPQPGHGDVFYGPDFWTPSDANTTWVDGHWHCVFPGVGPSTTLDVNGSWFVNYRPSWFHISFTESTLNDINLALYDSSIMAFELAAGNNVEHDLYLPITFGPDDIGSIFIEQTDPGLNPININLIEFL